MKVLSIILGPTNKLMRYLAFAMFSTMVFCVFAQVFFRYVLRMPAPWTEELARFTFIWATFLGAGIAFAEGGHLRVNFLLNMCKTPRSHAAMLVTADVFCLWFLGMYVVEGTKLSLRLMEMGQTSPAIPSLLMGAVYIAIPLGSCLMILNIIPKLYQHLHTLFTGLKPQIQEEEV